MASGTKPDEIFEQDLEELCKSIDRSRKRHLSVGLLRGDQVQDRLKTQEESASPFLKRHRPGDELRTPAKAIPGRPPTISEEVPEMAMTMAEFKEYMDGTTNKKLTELDENMAGIRRAVGRVESTVEKHSRKLDSHDAQIAEIRSEMRDIRAKPPDFPPCRLSHPSLHSGSNQEEKTPLKAMRSCWQGVHSGSGR